MRTAAAALITVVVWWLLTGCGMSYSRYPCQSAENWADPRCQPPVCVPTGDCTEYLIEVPDER